MINSRRTIVCSLRTIGLTLSIALSHLICPSLASADDVSQPVNLSTWNIKLRGALKAEAISRRSDSHASQVVKLCELYVQLRSDKRYADSDYLQGLATRARRRLIDVRDDLRRRLRRDGVTQGSGSTANVDMGFGPGAGDGWMLVELITRTISPDTWTSRGGSGDIMYFSLKRALVVRATTTVHEQIQALLRALGG